MKRLLVILTAVLFVALATLWIWKPNAQRLPGGYVLEQWENGKYYVQLRGGDESGGGTFDGTVEEIGWTRDRVLARVTRIFRGDPDGWYCLDVRTGTVRGPLSSGDVVADPVLREIRPHPPGQ